MTLYELRKSKNLTVKDVAEKMEISPSYYSHLELGRRKFTKELTSKCAEALGEDEHLIADKASLIKDRSLLSRSWISNIRVNGVNILKAFEEDLEYEPVSTKEVLVHRLASFAKVNIAQEITREFEKDKDLLDLFADRFNVK